MSLTLTGAGSGKTGGGGGITPINLLYDDDCDSDPDGFGDMAVIGDLADNGYFNWINVTNISRFAGSEPCMRATAEYGGFKTTASPATAFGAYQGNLSTIDNSSGFAGQVRDSWRPGDVRTNYADAVTQYRTVLAGLPDNSAVIIWAGPGTNIAGLLQSAADGISPLTGFQLVQAKVKFIMCVAGNWTTNASEPNIAQDVASANVIAGSGNSAVNSPCDIIWCNVQIMGSAGNLAVGRNSDRYTDPARFAYLLLGLPNGHPAYSSPGIEYTAFQAGLANDGRYTFGNGGNRFDVTFGGSPYNNITNSPSAKNLLLALSGSVTTSTILSGLQTRADNYSTRKESQWASGRWITNGILAEWLMNAGSGTTVTDLTGNGNTLTLGSGGNAPTWVAHGLHFVAASSQRATTAATMMMSGRSSFIVTAVVYLTTNNAVQCVFCQDDGGSNKVIQCRVNASGQIELVDFSGGTTTTHGTMQLATGTPYLLTWARAGNTYTLRVGTGGVNVENTVSATAPATTNVILTVPGGIASVGERGNTSTFWNGDIAYVAPTFLSPTDTVSADILALAEARARAQVLAGLGITV